MSRRPPSSSATSVVLADDDVHTRTGVCLTLEDAGFTVLAEVGDACAAVDASMRLHPALCVIEIKLPGGALKAIATIRRGRPDTAVVVLTLAYDECELIRALRAGASGYLLKDLPSARLPAALNAVLRGEPAIPRALVQRLIEELVHPRAGDAGPQGGLTARQREVLELLLGGLTTAEIASRLSVTDVTVRRHLSDILRRTGAADRNQLRERFGRGP